VPVSVFVGFCISFASLADAPTYQFRGFDSESTCDGVKDKEVDRGGKLLSYSNADGMQMLAYHIEAQLYGFNTTLVLTCGSDGYPTSIRYDLSNPDKLDLDAAFSTIYESMAERFGDVEIEPDTMGRSASFLCKHGYLISLNVVQAAEFTAEGSVPIRELFLEIFSGIEHCE
jgi:hypothetical protein